MINVGLYLKEKSSQVKAVSLIAFLNKLVCLSSVLNK